MRWSLRFALSASVFLIILLFFLKSRLEDLWDQYNVGSYISHTWTNTFKHGTVDSIPAFSGEAGDKIIIMAKLEKENTDWVTRHLPDWQVAIYTVDPTVNTTTSLTTPMNKGHEAMAYLSYIVDNYMEVSLPSTLVFLHSHRDGFFSGWHTDTPLHDNVEAVRKLELDFVQSNGYVNLRCNWNPGCLEVHRDNAHVTPEVWRDIFSGTTMDSNQPPQQVGAACCAQFAVSRDQVKKRPLSDYVQIRDWIVDTERSDAKSGRIMEFLWHVIFGHDAVYCPSEETCYCDVYGQC